MTRLSLEALGTWQLAPPKQPSRSHRFWPKALTNSWMPRLGVKKRIPQQGLLLHDIYVYYIYIDIYIYVPTCTYMCTYIHIYVCIYTDTIAYMHAVREAYMIWMTHFAM